MDEALERTWMYSQRVLNDYSQMADVAGSPYWFLVKDYPSCFCDAGMTGIIQLQHPYRII